MDDFGLSKLLLVEDDPDIREIAVMALEDIGGFAVQACEDGCDALVIAQNTRPDLIILDWMMPGMNGGETLARLREIDATSDIPVVFMTAKVRSDEIEKMLALGAIDVVAKPFDPVALPGRLRQIWAKHLARSGDAS
jgi:CheY-like chemotaxis protein